MLEQILTHAPWVIVLFAFWYWNTPQITRRCGNVNVPIRSIWNHTRDNDLPWYASFWYRRKLLICMLFDWVGRGVYGNEQNFITFKPYKPLSDTTICVSVGKNTWSYGVVTSMTRDNETTD